MARSMWMARRPNAVAVAANSTAVAGMKPPPSPMMAISAARPPRMRTIAFGSKLSRSGKSPRHASQKLPSASSGHAGRDDIGHGLRADAVGRRELQRAGVPEDHQRDQQQHAGDHHAGGVGPLARLSRPRFASPGAGRHRRACPGDPLRGLCSPGRPGSPVMTLRLQRSVTSPTPPSSSRWRRGSARPPGTSRTARPAYRRRPSPSA